MAGNAVQLDFSTFQPLPQQQNGQAVNLDMGTFKPAPNFQNNPGFSAMMQKIIELGKGEIKNDVGNTVIVPKPDEPFLDTMKRAAASGKNVTQDQIDREMATVPRKLPQLGAGIVGAAALIPALAATWEGAGALGSSAEVEKAIEVAKGAASSPLGKAILQRALEVGATATGTAGAIALLKKAGIL